MTRLLRAILLVLLAAVAARRAAADDQGCGVCHGKERVDFGKSVHRGADVGCVVCHGGDPSAVDDKEKAHAASKGFRGKVSRRDVAQACGACHADVARMRPFGLRTDALAEYRTSRHGKAMLEKGDVEAATCTDCHGVHDVRAVKDPASPAFHQSVPATCGKCHGDADLMKRHGIQTTAVHDFAASVHGRMLAAGKPGVPSCADCHDAHAATPPGAGEVADVCGACHSEIRDRFRESPHASRTARGSMKECVTCHGNHAVQLPDYSLFDAVDDAKIAGHGGTRCLTCHDPSKPEDRGAQTAIAFGKGLRAADADVAEAKARVDAVESEGFRVDDERAALERARNDLRRVVPLTHTVDRKRVESMLLSIRSRVQQARTGCEAKVREERDRRIFGTVAGVVLLGVAGVLALRGRSARKT